MLIGAALLACAQAVGMYDQGDYWRAANAFLEFPHSDEQGVRWNFAPMPTTPDFGSSSSAWLFWLASWVQRPFTAQFSSLAMGTMAQCGLLVLAERLAAGIATSLSAGVRARAGFAVALMLVFFAAHNVAFLNTLYMEFALFLFLPLVAYGILRRTSTSAYGLLVLGALMCGASKVQYFYFPLLVLVVVLLLDRGLGRRFDWRLAAALLLVRALCLVPLARNSYQQANYYHATYFGSYMVLTPEERGSLGLASEQEACIGIDAWGNRIGAADGVRIESTGHPCPPPQPIGMFDVLRPYLHYPQTLARLWLRSTDAHFTVKYFHVDLSNQYLQPTDGRDFGWGRALLRLTELRDRLIGPSLALVWLLLACAFGAWRPVFNGSALGAVALLLAAFSLSQFAVSLVGEGVRDLSRHWAGGQYALDLLVVVSFACLLAWRRQKNASWRSTPADAPSIPGAAAGSHVD